MKSRSSRSTEKKPADWLTLSVRIQPRASKNELLHQADGTLKIRLTAAPVDGAANEALIRFLSDRFSTSKSQIEIVSGHTGRDKIVRIHGKSEADAKRVLNSVE
jgi:hypothetical protein